MLNLLRDPCFPVLRKDGSRDTIAIWQLGDLNNPVVDFEAPRPDLRAAMLEFTIGLLQTVAAPSRDAQWAKLYQQPLPPDLFLPSRCILMTRWGKLFRFPGEKPVADTVFFRTESVRRLVF